MSAVAMVLPALLATLGCGDSESAATSNMAGGQNAHLLPIVSLLQSLFFTHGVWDTLHRLQPMLLAGATAMEAVLASAVQQGAQRPPARALAERLQGVHTAAVVFAAAESCSWPLAASAPRVASVQRTKADHNTASPTPCQPVPSPAPAPASSTPWHASLLHTLAAASGAGPGSACIIRALLRAAHALLCRPPHPALVASIASSSAAAVRRCLPGAASSYAGPRASSDNANAVEASLPEAVRTVWGWCVQHSTAALLLAEVLPAWQRIFSGACSPGAELQQASAAVVVSLLDSDALLQACQVRRKLIMFEVAGIRSALPDDGIAVSVPYGGPLSAEPSDSRQQRTLGCWSTLGAPVLVRT
jgi:hypothetical protein